MNIELKAFSRKLRPPLPQSIVILKKLYTRKLPKNVENFITNYESFRYLCETDFTNINLPDLSIILLAQK